MAMAGLPCFTKNYRRPGTKGFAFIYFLPSGMRSTQKAPGAPTRSQASYPIALKFFTKTLLIGIGSINRVRRHLPIKKPSKKHKNLTSEGRRFRSPFFLCLTRNFKAVAMGVVAAIEFVFVKCGHIVVWCTMLPVRARSGPRKHQRRARSGDISGSTIIIVYRH